MGYLIIEVVSRIGKGGKPIQDRCPKGDVLRASQNDISKNVGVDFLPNHFFFFPFFDQLKNQLAVFPYLLISLTFIESGVGTDI